MATLPQIPIKSVWLPRTFINEDKSNQSLVYEATKLNQIVLTAT